MDIVIKNLCKKYDGITVLSNYNEVFKEGQVSLIMGTSGIGKTTLIRILMGLEKADSGTIKGIDDKRISAVFQEDSLCQNLSVIANIKLVCDDIDKDKIEKALEILGLKDYGNKRVRELSGGMKRRVAILRAIMYKFDLLIMDEPFKGLDLETKNKVVNFIKDNIKGKTIILITHDLDDINCFDNSRILDLKSREL